MSGLKTLMVGACLLVAVTAQTPPAYTPRKLPADVLRDFPGACFGSTACSVFTVNQEWPLYPFCGKATCVSEGGKLYEQVTECPRPKPKEGCEIQRPQQDPSVTYPNCCAQPVCVAGVTAEWYTQEEAEALAKQEAEQARQAQQAATTATSA
ncbi:hypothetical protein Pmani_024014 [Petrolisthes manimaculis]|uniref:Single domain-containing protein n=1 Tax=Petrolisthes manimaculis TaxID=1843537 RepID=A0AAE1PA24_9EUCA|nr:hypothetical protein Pmani_024014 [Petrolisthes manimaculis]